MQKTSPQLQEERPIGSVSSELFFSYAGEDHVIDARDLRDMLSDLFRRGEPFIYVLHATSNTKTSFEPLQHVLNPYPVCITQINGVFA